jgi:hypothetical protein
MNAKPPTAPTAADRSTTASSATTADCEKSATH